MAMGAEGAAAALPGVDAAVAQARAGKLVGRRCAACGWASFTEALGKSEGAAGTEAVAPAGIEELVGRFRAGEISMDALLDSLVEGAVQGAPLGERGRMELREALRAAVENDPTLRRLAREIEQG